MTKSLQVLEATLDDVAELEKLVNSAYRGESSKKGWTTEADLLDGIRTSRESLTEQINNPNALILKGVNKEGEICGCVYLERKESSLYLGMLTVSPTLQNSGIGKVLLAAAEDYARASGLFKLSMTVISLRKELIKWYERRGYRKTNRKEAFPNDPRFGIPKQSLEFIIMEKAINL